MECRGWWENILNWDLKIWYRKNSKEMVGNKCKKEWMNVAKIK